MNELSLAVAPLETVTATISTLHTKQQEYAQKAWENALEIGRLLSETRPTLKHGEWLNWTDQLPFSDRTARNYIRVYENRDNPKLETVSNLKEAYRLLAEPKAEPKELAPPRSDGIEESRFIPAPGHGLIFQWQHHDKTLREVWIVPSEHEGFHFVTEITNFENGSATAEGSRRPIKTNAITGRAGIVTIPPEATRQEIPMEAANYNIWLYNSEAEAKEANRRHLLGY